MEIITSMCMYFLGFTILEINGTLRITFLFVRLSSNCGLFLEACRGMKLNINYSLVFVEFHTLYGPLMS